MLRGAAMKSSSLALAAALVLGLVACSSSPEATDDGATAAGASALVEVTGFGSNPGGLRMYEYGPSGLGSGAPLVVALHGCTQTAADYTKAGWNGFADKQRFWVLYPEQQTSNNQNRCFDWFQSEDISRGSGEALSIKQMVDAMIARHGIDPKRVFVTGLSAGGAMTNVMLAAYPDVFAAGAVMAGLPYACATGMSDAFTCMNPGKNDTPSGWAARVKAASSYPGPWPRVSIWHGASDTTVAPANLSYEAAQWTAVHGADQKADLTETVGPATHAVYTDSSGKAVVETWSIAKMPHGTAVDPSRGCGAAGAYVLDVGLCSTKHALDFFGLGDGASADAGAGGSDAGAPGADAGSPPPPPPPPPVTTCHAVSGAIYDHVAKGRAYRCGVGGSYACALGSDARIGLYTMMPATLRETSPGYWEIGACP